jgi:phosphoserine phosphatase RsbU/P
MNILIAEDDPISRHVLQTTLLKWGYEVEAVCDGAAAWEVLRGDGAPPLAVLDWMMPGLDGVEVCRRVRELGRPGPTYLLLLTARTGKENVVAGLEAGADDYLTKPFDRDELRARLQVGRRLLGMQRDLADRVAELEEALARVKQLQGLLPICCYCKKIRDDQNYWQQVEQYLSAHAEVRFSHGICPDCFETVIKPDIKRHYPDGVDPRRPT